MTKVLNLSYDDYANFAFENCQALIAVGIDALSLKKKKHPFGYEQESELATDERIMLEIRKADIVQLFHSDSKWLDYAVSFEKRVMVYHTGTTYRMNPGHLNSIFNDKVEICFTDQCEFMGLGMKNETYIATAVNTEKIKPLDWNITKPFTVAHFPSSAETKGTNKIGELLSVVKQEFKYSVSRAKVDHEHQILRMNMCDIYVELFAPTQNGRPYGCFGVTAFEAAAMGKIVFTNNIRNDVYVKAYGGSPFEIVNTEDDFIKKMEEVLQYDHYEMAGICRRSREIIHKRHGYEGTGFYLKKCLNL